VIKLVVPESPMA
jgi:hypothetical protein